MAAIAERERAGADGRHHARDREGRRDAGEEPDDRAERAPDETLEPRASVSPVKP